MHDSQPLLLLYLDDSTLTSHLPVDKNNGKILKEFAKTQLSEKVDGEYGDS